MPKNALFLLKNPKNRRALGALPPDPHWPTTHPPHDEFLAARLNITNKVMA